MNGDLLCTPRQAKLGTREPNATALDDGGDLRSLDNQILNGNTLVRSTLEIIELGVPLAVLLGKLDLHVRRVRQDITLLVLAVLESRGIECFDDLAIQIGLEPRLGVLDTLIDHQLIELLQDSLELLQLRTLLLTAEGQIDRVLIGSLLILECVQAKGRLHGNRGLNDHATTIVVQIRLLRAALKHARGRDGNRLGVEGRRVNDSGHDWKFDDLLYAKIGRQILFFWRQKFKFSRSRDMITQLTLTSRRSLL